MAAWMNGRHLISQISFQYQGKIEALSLYIIKDGEFDAYYFNVCRGDFQSATPDAVIQSFVMTNASGTGSGGKTEIQVIAEVAADLNKKLTAVYGGSVPTTWIERLEVAMQKMSLFLSGNIPQIK